MTERNELEAGLSKAQATPADAVISAAKVDEDRPEANAEVEKVRARCRCLRAALLGATDSFEP